MKSFNRSNKQKQRRAPEPCAREGHLQNAVEVGSGDDLPRDDDDEGAPSVAPDVRPRLPEPPHEPAPFLRLRQNPAAGRPGASAAHARGGAPAPPGDAGDARPGPRRRDLAAGDEARGGGGGGEGRRHRREPGRPAAEGAYLVAARDRGGGRGG